VSFDMIEQIEAKDGLVRRLSTGTILLTYRGESADGELAWGATMLGKDGSTMDFGLGDEAFLAFVESVEEMRNDI
jgi:hypothetical protein